MSKTVTKILLFISIIFFWFAQYVYIPYQTPYLFSLGAASAFVGIIVGAYGFSQMVLRIPAAIFADIYKRQKALILLGTFCSALSSVFRVLFPSPVMFLIANLFSGIASTMWVSYTIFYSSLYKKEELNKAMGYSLAANNGGILLGFIAGAFINDSLGIKFVFISAISGGILAFITALFLREEPSKRSAAKFLSFFGSYKNKPLIFYSLIAVILQAVIMSSALSFTMSYAKQITGSELALGVSSAIFIASSFAVSLVVSRVKEKDIRLVMAVLFGCLIIYCIFVPLSQAMWELYLLQLAAGIGNGGLMPLLMTKAMKASTPDNKTSIMGFFQAVYGLGMTLGPMLMGALIGGSGYLAGYWVMALLSALCIAALYAVKLGE